MELNKIESLAQILNEKSLTAIEVEEGGVRMRIEKNNGATISGAAIESHRPTAAMEYDRAPAKPAEASSAATKEVVSPLVGIVYLSPSPESEPYVSVGQRVHKGDVLCIVDAMKMLNEIASTEDGIIKEICVENGAIVDYGACLFRLSQE